MQRILEAEPQRKGLSVFRSEHESQIHQIQLWDRGPALQHSETQFPRVLNGSLRSQFWRETIQEGGGR